MRVGKNFGDKIAIPQAKKRFGWTAKILTPIYQTAKNLTEFFNIFLRIVENISVNDRNYSG